jgi:hypothetical protein
MERYESLDYILSGCVFCLFFVVLALFIEQRRTSKKLKQIFHPRAEIYTKILQELSERSKECWRICERLEKEFKKLTTDLQEKVFRGLGLRDITRFGNSETAEIKAFCGCS